MRVVHGIALAALILSAAPAAGELPVSTVASFGPAPSVGIGAKDFGPGHTFALETAWHPERSTGWLLRAGRTDLSRDVKRDPNLMVFGNSQLYVPVPPGDEVAVDVSFLQLGIRQTHALGAVRPYVEAVVGASFVRDAPSRVEGGLTNDRRAAWSAPSPSPGGYETEIAPSLGLGFGAVTVLPGRVAFATSVGADFTAVHGLVGAQLPVRFGATWPAGPLTGITHVDAPRAPRLRASAGPSALHTPRHVSGGLNGGQSYAAEVELPLGARVALSFAGEHDTRAMRETIYRQEMSNFGTLELVPSGTTEGSFAATVATLGARIRQPLGRAAFSLRSGIGFGRTSGFGTTVRSVNGAYVDASGQWLPAVDLANIGAGAAATGWAWAMSAGAELRIAGGVRGFAESGLTSIELDGDHVRSTPLRFGIALN